LMKLQPKVQRGRPRTKKISIRQTC
jgi:hypothetical protein